jgi:hypothetical protein
VDTLFQIVMPGGPKGIVVSNRWYFQPDFFLKVIWCIFSIALIVILAFYARQDSDIFWCHVVSPHPYRLLISVLVFFAVAVAATICLYLDVLPARELWIFVTVIASTGVSVVISIAFIAKYGTAAHRNALIEDIRAYWRDYKTRDDLEWIRWFWSHIMKSEQHDFDSGNTIIWNYVDGRTEDIGSAMIGCFITWGLFHGIWLYRIRTGDKWGKNEQQPPDKEAQSSKYTNSPLTGDKSI